MSNSKTVLALLPAIRATCAKYLRSNPSQIDDSVNDTVVRLLSGSLEACNGEASLKTWATITARSVALDYLKASASNGHESVNATDAASDDDSVSLGTVLTGVDGRNVAERALQVAQLQAAMKVLSADDRTFVELIAAGHVDSKAGASLGWSKVATCRKRKAIVAKLQGATCPLPWE
jgi:RNA polymerase sigma factor (sigma-70 family)